ncbi:MAG TPA: N,N-dimethylformamidase beta subunit family domain-containing protein, partial [Mycobacterium sp.]
MALNARGDELIGYTDTWSVAPGDDIHLHASASASEIVLDLVRLRHGDPNPAGPGLKVDEVPSEVSGTHPVAEQRIRAGSYARLTTGAVTGTLAISVWTPRPAAGHPQTLLHRGDVTVFLDADGVPGATVGGVTATADAPLVRERWHDVEVRLGSTPTLLVDGVVVATSTEHVAPPVGPVTLAATAGACDFFTGKLEELRLDDRTYDVRELELVNGPTLAVTGRLWDDDTTDFRSAPEQYAAVHFHEDDLDDAKWPVTATLTIPDDLRSGIYAFRLRAGDLVDHVPFVVTPPCGTASADIALLLPTVTYLAYSNERLIAATGGMVPTDSTAEPADADRWLAQHPEAGSSVYDRHPDGSGVCLVSMRRPIPNLRPDFVWWNTNSPERFGSDLYIADFLDHRGDPWDALTDHDLHDQGVALLTRYRVIVTGTHPEYCTRNMLVALQSYLEAGGRLLYLGGNGFYWVTSIDPQNPHRAEVRRGINGTRAWTSRPGELRHQTTGEQGGLWRYRNRSPNRLVGVGFAAQADSAATAPGYRRTKASYDAEFEWLFAGVSDSEVLGDYGLYVGGAAGYEIDRHDPALGSPDESVVVMTSAGAHPDAYLLVVEDTEVTIGNPAGPDNPDVRSDVVLLPYESGGCVFS